MKHRDTRGRLVLEDLPETIESLGELHPRVEKKSHNFFVPQPVHGKTSHHYCHKSYTDVP
jgi:hypothetical protein